MRYWVVMPAAGAGRRFGAQAPKQYAALAGRTVIEWALDVFIADPRCRAIVVALGAEDPHWPGLSLQAASGRVLTTLGGAERSESVLRGLEALPAAADDWVLVHDAARPCVSPAEITALTSALADHAVGGLLALPLADTLKRADESGAIDATLPRRGLWRALTPQMFRHGMLSTALRKAQAAGERPTDEAQAIEMLGLRPMLVEGSALNIKVTTASDLKLAAAVLRMREQQA